MNNDDAQGAPGQAGSPATTGQDAAAATAELVSRGFAGQDALRMLASARRMMQGGPARGLIRTENVAVTYLGNGRYRIDVTPRRINLAARFTLDEAAARDYAGRVIAAHGNGGIPADDSPRFGAAWDPRGPDEEATVARLVRYAAGHGVIVCPDGMNLAFVYDPDASDGGSYYFAVDIGHDFVDQVTLSSWPTEMRKLVDDETGAEAALSILGEAVARANRVLDKLAALITSHGGTVTAATS